MLAQDSRNGSDDDDDEEMVADSLGPISQVHLLTGRIEWPVRFQEGGGPGKKGRVWIGQGKGNT